MKVLIWLGCIIVYSAVVTALRFAGVLLGGIPTVLLALLLVFLPAPALCKWWAKRKMRPALQKEQPKERWYTCQKCGQLVRDGEVCDCEAVKQRLEAGHPTASIAQEQEQPGAEPSKKRKYSALEIGLMVACCALILLSAALGYHVYKFRALSIAALEVNNGLLQENKELTAQIEALGNGIAPSFSSWTDWNKLHEAGCISMTYQEWLGFWASRENGVASDFLREAAEAQAEKIDEEYGPWAYGGTGWGLWTALRDAGYTSVSIEEFSAAFE